MWQFNWNYRSTLKKKKNTAMTRSIAHNVPSILYCFSKKIMLLILWLFKCHYYSGYKWVFWHSEQTICCRPQTEGVGVGSMSRRCPWDWQRAWEDMIYEIIWVVSGRVGSSSCISTITEQKYSSVFIERCEIQVAGGWRGLVSHFTRSSYKDPDSTPLGVPFLED